MPFQLSRAGNNMPAEVQRWQYFLRRQGIGQAGAIDADFGLKTETATKIFQVTHGLSATGKVNERTLEEATEFGYTIVPDNYYTQRSGPGFPKEPAGLSSPSNASRNKDFTCFKFIQRPLAQRPDTEAIVQKGSCDGSKPDWVAAHIIDI
jgi:peptidoglycan hydrolase-like protein with peptidoglycan-binding domain